MPTGTQRRIAEEPQRRLPAIIDWLALAALFLLALNLLLVFAPFADAMRSSGLGFPARTASKPLLLFTAAFVLFLLFGNRTLHIGDCAAGRRIARLSSKEYSALLILFAAVVYLPAVAINFQHPDWTHRHISAGLHSFGAFLRLFATPQADGMYRPLTFGSLWADYAIFGTRLWGYHLQSIAIHLLNAGLVGVLAVRLGFSKSVARLAALIFGVASIHVEAVVWPAARFDLLATTFGIVSLVLFLDFWRGEPSSAFRPGKRDRTPRPQLRCSSDKRGDTDNSASAQFRCSSDKCGDTGGSASYQGTTSVVPIDDKVKSGFSPCAPDKPVPPAQRSAADTPHPSNERRGSLVSAALSLLAFAAAVLNKETGYALVFIVAALIATSSLWRIYPQRTRNAVVYFAALLAVAATLFAVRWTLYGGVSGYTGSGGQSIHTAITLKSCYLLVVNTIAGSVLGLNTSGPASVWLPLVAAAFVAIAVMIAAVSAGAREPRRWALLLLALLSALPALSVIGWVQPSLMHTRHLYLPSVWIAILLASLLHRRSPLLLLSAFLLVQAAALGYDLYAWRNVIATADSLAQQIVRDVRAASAPSPSIRLIGLPEHLDGVLYFGPELRDRVHRSVPAATFDSQPASLAYSWSPTARTLTRLP